MPLSPSFAINHSVLERLIALNRFVLPPGADIIFFGIRGALPSFDSTGFADSQDITLQDINYLTPRCVMGQWLPAQQKVAVFPGSTVPHRKHILTAVANGGAGCNQMIPGLYLDYKTGFHKISDPNKNGHAAFVQTADHPARRTSDNLTFDDTDRIDISNQADNIHAGYCMTADTNFRTEMESAGCQVVVGMPSNINKTNRPEDIGPWHDFRKNGYDRKTIQPTFPYFLLPGNIVWSVAEGKSTSFQVRLRFGSSGDEVKVLQQKLVEQGFYQGIVDGGLGPKTFRALELFQRQHFDGAADGVVGEYTASLLGMTLPMG